MDPDFPAEEVMLGDHWRGRPRWRVSGERDKKPRSLSSESCVAIVVSRQAAESFTACDLADSLAAGQVCTGVHSYHPED
jgi:hypothetical protein